MNDQEDQDLDPQVPSFEDPSHDEIRALLAGVRVTAPMPADVAARLDATLDSLRAETGADPVAPVVPLRRRRVPRLLVAAAVVAVVGGGAVGVAQLVGGGSGSSGSNASSADSATDQSGTGSALSGSAGTAPSERAPAAMAAGQEVPRLARATFARDAAAVMRTVTAVTAEAAVPSPTASPPAPAGSVTPTSGDFAQAPPVTATPDLRTKSDSIQQTCPGPVATDAVTLAAVLDGDPVALVFRPPTSSGQRVEAWSCDGSRLLVSATVRH